jgi:hypothetical protein
MYLYSFDFFCDETGKTYLVEIECNVYHDDMGLKGTEHLVLEEQRFFILSDAQPFKPITDLSLLERAKYHYYKFERDKCYNKITQDFEEVAWQKEN